MSASIGDITTRLQITGASDCLIVELWNARGGRYNRDGPHKVRFWQEIMLVAQEVLYEHPIPTPSNVP